MAAILPRAAPAAKAIAASVAGSAGGAATRRLATSVRSPAALVAAAADTMAAGVAPAEATSGSVRAWRGVVGGVRMMSTDSKDGAIEAEFTEAGDTGVDAAASAGTDAGVSDDAAGAAAAEPAEVVDSGTAERHHFEAETGQLLQIVAHSLYTDKHVFIRELVSNASDALEKLRHLQVTGQELVDSSAPLEIHITTDEAAGTFTIQDSGVGLNREELVENLGMIARSGSKAFLNQLMEEGAAGANDVGSSLIGQFGVGFYSSFMVSNDVRVLSASALPGNPAHQWKSAGDGSYEIARADNVARGTKIVVQLKPECKEFSTGRAVEDIIKKYSSFVQFPIFVNGKQVNTVQAVWALTPSEVTEEQYDGFYKHVSHHFDSPMYRLHFTSDAPISLQALFYVGQQHMEKFNMAVQKPGVSLYSRKVLIEPESGVMPMWLRFVHGVVDSEDIPLNISRESMQDSALIQRIRNVLTRRFIRFLDQNAKKDPAKYLVFFREFGRFLKEGICSDRQVAPEVAKLLRYESTALPPGEMTSLDEYISRLEPTQKSIYYIVAANRKMAEASPYMEAFKGTDTEVLLMYDGVDDFVMSNLVDFNGRQLVTAEAGSIDLSKDGASSKKDKEGDGDDAKDDSSADAPPLKDDEVKELGEWMMGALPDKLSKVDATSRLSTSPAVVVDHESAAMRRMRRFVEDAQGDPTTSSYALPPQHLAVNPKHPVIVSLHALRNRDVTLATTVAEQVLDNALVAAGLMDDSREMLPRLNTLLTRLMESQTGGASAGAGAEAASEAPEAEAPKFASVDLDAATTAAGESAAETKSA